jgi:hypothetical protein
METNSNQSTSKGNDNNIFLILIILIVAILWFTGSLNPRKERFWGDGDGAQFWMTSDGRGDGILDDGWDDMGSWRGWYNMGRGYMGIGDYGREPDYGGRIDNRYNLCCGGQGGTRRTLLCEPNTVVTRFTGRAGDMIDNIGIECSDGRSVNAVGGSGGNSFNTHSPTGFNKLIVGADRYVNSIRFFNDNDKEVGQRVGSGDGNQHTLNCVNGRIRGLDVNSGDLIDRIQVVC